MISFDTTQTEVDRPRKILVDPVHSHWTQYFRREGLRIVRPNPQPTRIFDFNTRANLLYLKVLPKNVTSTFSGQQIRYSLDNDSKLR